MITLIFIMQAIVFGTVLYFLAEHLRAKKRAKLMQADLSQLAQQTSQKVNRASSALIAWIALVTVVIITLMIKPEIWKKR